jgi:methylmalonyl-CoA mutase N-terminal domain/subunit
MDNQPPISAMNLAGNLGEVQSEKLAKWRTNRDQEKVNFSIKEIKSAAISGSNLFPIIIDAIRNECTLGEIMNAMKDEFGTWMAPSGF